MLSRTTKPAMMSTESSEKSRWKSRGRSGSSQNGGLLSRIRSWASSVQRIMNLTSYASYAKNQTPLEMREKDKLTCSSSWSTSVNSWLECPQLIANSFRAHRKSNTNQRKSQKSHMKRKVSSSAGPARRTLSARRSSRSIGRPKSTNRTKSSTANPTRSKFLRKSQSTIGPALATWSSGWIILTGVPCIKRPALSVWRNSVLSKCWKVTQRNSMEQLNTSISAEKSKTCLLTCSRSMSSSSSAMMSTTRRCSRSVLVRVTTGSVSAQSWKWPFTSTTSTCQSHDALNVI